MAEQSPWGKISEAKAVASLEEIMSEQLANDIHEKELKMYSDSFLTVNDGIAVNPLNGKAGCENDFMIARFLQIQFDKEHDAVLQQKADKYNGTSKVNVNYDNYKALHSFDEDSDSDNEEMDDPQHWDSFEASEAAFPAIPKCGYRRTTNTEGTSEIVTKHDITMANRRNACRVMEFPPEFQTGDGGGFDMKLSNQVYNSLKRYSNIEQQRRGRFQDKAEIATSEKALDERTRLMLHKWINSGLIDSVGGILSTGKESVVLRAEGGVLPDGTKIPRDCAVKIFKTTLNEFKEREKYIKDDYRYKGKYAKQNNRKLIDLWAEKEMRNLVRMKNAGVNCPEVIRLKKHVILMEFIGDESQAGSILKDAILDESDLILAYDQIVQGMKDMYNNANLIHADLSEYNILWHNKQCWFIDVGQAVTPKHPGATTYLLRDCSNITKFFEKKGLESVLSEERLFQNITGVLDRTPAQCISDAELKLQVENFERDAELLLLQEPINEYPFELCWEKALKKNQKQTS